MLHGDHDYYYELATKHDAVVHAFVAYSRRMFDRLCELLPHRRSTIFYMPYGIELPRRIRRRSSGPLRLVFAGRLEHGQKGVLDLPAIDAQLRQRDVDVVWTVIGGGPDETRLREMWPPSPRTVYTGPLDHRDTVDRLADHDVFVLPTRAEGLPVSLLESMGAGLVPVVSNIPSGVPDVVDDGRHGLLPNVGDVVGFTDAIRALATDRDRLERMSGLCRRRVEDGFDVRSRVKDYHSLYARYAELYRPLAPRARLQYGSRLDRPWIPNGLVKLVRSSLRARQA
jgi:glycosyltransferase involved in cell wall biosynthesis